MPSKATVFSGGAAQRFSDRLANRLKHSVPLRLLIVCALLIFSPLLEGGTTHLAVMIIRLVVLVLLAVHLWDGIRKGSLPRSLHGLGPAVTAFLGLALISTLMSPYMNQSLQWLLVLLTYAGLLYLLVCSIREWDHAFKLLWVVLGVGLFEAGWAVVQWGMGSLRPTGTFFNPNFLAGYLAAVAALLLGLLSYVPWRRSGRKLWAGLGLFALGLLFCTIILTGSRGGMLAWIAGLAFIMMVRFGRKAVGVVLIAVVVGLALPNPLRERLWAEHTVNPVAYTRLQIWQSSLRQVVDHPFGGGLGLYQYLYQRYSVPVEGQIARYGKTAQTAHSEYVQMVVELGAASLLVFAWGVVVLSRRVNQTLKRRLHRQHRGFLVGTAGAIVVMLVHAAVDSPFHEPALAILLALCAALILRAYRISVDSETTPTIEINSPGSRWVWAGVGTIAVAGIGMVVLRVGFAWMAFEAGSNAFAQQRFPEAIAHYETALSLDPGKALYHSSMGAAQYQIFQRTHDERTGRIALAELEEAVALNPLDGRLEGLRGGLYRSFAVSQEAGNDAVVKADAQRWLHLALQALQNAVELDPHNPFHRLELGRVLRQLGKMESAEASVRDAVALEPNFLPGRDWLARHYLQSGQVEAARQEYQQIVERQQRYVKWSKDPVEASYLKVDVKSLEATLQKAGA
jgi:O-antigen ligase